MTIASAIALLGVSGVGKSRFAARIATARPEVLRLSAGRLLREALHTTGRVLRTAASDTVLQNQSHLVEAVAAARAGQWERPVLIEAHAFIDNDRELVDVPAEVMRAMDVRGFLVLVAAPVAIRRRRGHDRDRVRPVRTVRELCSQQQHLLSVARRYAKDLSADMMTVDADDLTAALHFVDRVASVRAQPGQ